MEAVIVLVGFVSHTASQDDAISAPDGYEVVRISGTPSVTEMEPISSEQWLMVGSQKKHTIGDDIVIPFLKLLVSPSLLTNCSLLSCSSKVLA